MGKLPLLLVSAVVLWVAWDVYQKGPEHAVGGLFALLAEPQYGEADRPTRSGDLADRVLEEGEPGQPAPPED